MAEGGIEKRTLRTILGSEEDGIASTDAYDLVVRDHGMKSGLQFDSVSITPVVEPSVDATPDKTVQVLYTQETKMQGNLKFATVAVCEIPREIKDKNTVSKVVHLRKNNPALANMDSGNESHNGAFASDPEALKYFQLGPRPETPNQLQGCQQEGIFVSDPEAMKYIRLDPKPPLDLNSEDPEGVYASDPEAFKFFRFGPKVVPASPAPDEGHDLPGIVASDPETLKLIKFSISSSKPEPNISGDADEPEGIIASDPEALQWIKLIPKHSEGKKTPERYPCKDDAVFASDPETFKVIRMAQNQLQANEISAGGVNRLDDGEGNLIAEASGIHLQDNREYSVRVSGYDLPDGQQKKFLAVRSTDGSGGRTSQEIDAMEVTVETNVGKDGLIEKFIAVD